MPTFKARTFGIRQQTDVVTQRYLAMPGVDTGGDEGEIIVNAERAAQEGARRKGGAARELALYIAHGMDHLAGFDDATPAERQAMRRREMNWLAALQPLPDSLLLPPGDAE